MSFERKNISNSFILFAKLSSTIISSTRFLSIHYKNSNRNIAILNTLCCDSKPDKISKKKRLIKKESDQKDLINKADVKEITNIECSKNINFQHLPYYLSDKVIGAKTYVVTEKNDNNLYHQNFLGKKLLDHSTKNAELTKNIANNLFLEKDKLASLITSIRKFPLCQMPCQNLNDMKNDLFKHYQDTFEIFQNVQKLPSVKTILRETMTKDSSMKLFIWRNKMIKEMGEDKFLKYNKGLIRHGGKLHTLIEQKYKGQLIDESLIPQENKGHWESLKNAFAILPHIDVHEKPLIHPHLGYLGIVDALGDYNGQKCAIEWKTSVKPKTNLIKTLDTPLQIAAYIGALNFGTNPYNEQPITDALIVIAYQSGDPADIFHLSLELTTYYWQEWLYRLSLFWANKFKRP